MRRYLTLQTLGLSAIAIAVIAVMIGLGIWQLGVYDDHQHDDAVAKLKDAPQPLDDLIGPDDAFPGDGVGVPVVVSGQYDAAAQLFVETSTGYEVVAPLVTDNGSAILVVRGSSDVPGALAPPDGTVELTGILEPSAVEGRPIDRDRVTDALDISSLVAAVPTDLYAGYLVATKSAPTDPLPIVAPPLPDASRWAGLRNLIYAIQWWCFAAFVLFMWWRVLTDLSRESADRSLRSVG